ncbi:MAG: PEP-CTERM sorting domain-containing protein [Phenylobacterium sp.]|uniref:LamG-like jellyroll fold domain-containing protein n=1 Tax=Phenylobacterium sp. TaxID=1871053 RepID=UPI0025ED3AE1|nr:LamG-like jellyroll fold domain-containing protein [Phenylobacterium sp.]MBI1196525.1 PEP-CTERM sorting domain-containing protein [Phenylobacterium sp.]
MKLKTAANAALLAMALSIPAAAHAVVMPDHSFALDGDLADSIGGATLSLVGSATLGAGGVAFDAGEGLSLTGAFADPAVYSVEIFFRFDSAGAYSRILNGSGTDNGLYVHSSGGPKVDYYEGGAIDGAAFSLGEMHHLVFSRSTAGATVYLDGASALTTAAFGSSTVPGALLFFIDDQAEEAPGYVDFIQTYDRALTGEEVASLYGGGQPTPYGGVGGVPEPATWALMILGFAGAGAALRRRGTALA